MEYWPNQICPECIVEAASVVNFCDKIKQTQLTIEARYGKEATVTTSVVVPEDDDTIMESLGVMVGNEEHVYEIKYVADCEQSEVDGAEISIEPLVEHSEPQATESEHPSPSPTPAKTRKKHQAKREQKPESAPSTDRATRRLKRSRSPVLPEEDHSMSPNTTTKQRIHTSRDINAALLEYGVLSCKLCPEQLEFLDFKTTRQHNQEVHDLSGVACCTKIYSSRIRLFEHVQFHLAPETIACDICQKQFKSRASLKTHKEDHHAETEISCASCEFTCKSEKILRRHELTHIPMEERSVACELCDFKCNFVSQLTVHMSAKHSEQKEAHFCEECGKSFSTKGNLMNHHKSFHDPAAIKPVCGQCGKSVRRLSRHLSICQKKLALKCPDCSNVHPNMHALRTHILRMHRKDTSKLTCKICNKVLSREAHLRVSGMEKGGEVRRRLHDINLTFIAGAHGEPYENGSIQVPVLRKGLLQ